MHTCARCHHLWHGRAVPPRPQMMQAEVGAVVRQRQREVEMQGSHSREQRSSRGENLGCEADRGGQIEGNEKQIDADGWKRRQAASPVNPTAATGVAGGGGERGGDRVAIAVAGERERGDARRSVGAVWVRCD